MVYEKNKLAILEEPYVSAELADYLAQEKIGVLSNNFSNELNNDMRNKLNLLTSEQFIEKYNNGGLLYTNSENALSWIINNIDDKELLETIDNVKDKVKFRKLLKNMNPKFYYEEVSLEDLNKIDSNQLPLPIVLKPSIGFFSVGVYTIETTEDWTNAVGEIISNHREWKKSYAESVVADNYFILEGYIEGEEYAIDAYFDENGKAVILNIMKHEFSGNKDVSDRLYYSGYQVIKDNVQEFTEYLNEMNKYLKAVNFPVHIEIRVKNNEIIPIECNPMRFAGWCTTDLTLFAFGFRTYDYFLNNTVPDWENILKGKENSLYGMVVLDKSEEIKENSKFDYEGIEQHFEHVIKLRKLDFHKHPVFGFVFTETQLNNKEELTKIMTLDLQEYIR